MKLKNKKTGMIGEVYSMLTVDGEIMIKNTNDLDEWYKYNSLAELCEELEDYEEPKSAILNIWTGNKRNKTVHIKVDSEENTKELCRKLRAWKRLGGKGFRFTAWENGVLLDGTIAGQVRYEFPIDNKDEIEKDLDLLLGGKK